MPRSVASSIDKIARQTVGKDWSLYAALLEHWQEIVGADYAAHTTPSKITFPYQPNNVRRGSGTLTIRLPKGLAMEFTFKTDQIRQRINSYFGYKAIAKIAFEPVYGEGSKRRNNPRDLSAAEKTILTQTTETIDNKDLATALQSFGEALLKTTATHEEFLPDDAKPTK